MSLIQHLRIDIGDNDGSLAAASGTFTMLDLLKVDIGNDAGLPASVGGVTTVDDLVVNGYLALTPITINNSYNLPSGASSAVLVDNTSSAPVTVTLPPSPVSGQLVIIKDVSGTAFTYPITVSPVTGTIDGFPTFILSNNYQSVTFYYNGTSWSII